MNMKEKPQLEQSMQEEQIHTALNAHWHASAAGDANAEHAEEIIVIAMVRELERPCV